MKVGIRAKEMLRRAMEEGLRMLAREPVMVLP